MRPANVTNAGVIEGELASTNSLDNVFVLAQQLTAAPMRIAVLLNKPQGLHSQKLNIEPSDLERLLSALCSAQSLTTPTVIEVNQLWFMPALEAAQCYIKADGFINGVGLSDNAAQAKNSALVHGKRIESNYQESQKDTDIFTHLRQAILTLSQRRSFEQCEKYWFVKRHQSRIVVLGQSIGQLQLSLVLTQGQQVRSSERLISHKRLWLPFSASNLGELTDTLTSFDTALSHIASLPSEQSNMALLRWQLEHFQQFEHLQNTQSQKLTGVLMATDSTSSQTAITSLRQEISGLMQFLTVTQIQSSSQHFQTPAGSFFTLMPKGTSGLTFVYPGVGTVYEGMFEKLP